MKLKTCYRCKVDRLPSEYCGHKYTTDGLHWVCNRCLSELYVRRQRKVECRCGKKINESYLNKHIHTGLHSKNLQNIEFHEYMQPTAAN